MKNNKLIIIALLIPLVFILGIFTVVYIPNISVKTEYNFVYALCDGLVRNSSEYKDCQTYVNDTYLIDASGNIITPTTTTDDITVYFFLHDTKENMSTEITLEEAQQLTLLDRKTSPDNVHIEGAYDRAPSFLFFDGGSGGYKYYLVDGKGRKQLNLVEDEYNYYYRNDIPLLGWIAR